MPDEITWTIGDRIASALVDETPVLERGAEISLAFLFRGGKLHADGTLHDDGTFHGDLRAHYQRLLERLEYADAVVNRGRSANGVPFVVEDIPDRAPVETQIVYVEPATDVVDAEPFWAAIVGGETATRPAGPSDPRTVTLDLFVLAHGAEYASREELTSDLGGGVV